MNMFTTKPIVSICIINQKASYYIALTATRHLFESSINFTTQTPQILRLESSHINVFWLQASKFPSFSNPLIPNAVRELHCKVPNFSWIMNKRMGVEGLVIMMECGSGCSCHPRGKKTHRNTKTHQSIISIFKFL